MDNGGSMVDNGCSVVDNDGAVVDGVMDKGSGMDRGMMDSVNGSMCVVDWHVRPVHAVRCLEQHDNHLLHIYHGIKTSHLWVEGGEAGVRPGSGQGEQQQRDGLQ